MKKKLSVKQLSDLQFMRDWSMEIINYSLTKYQSEILNDFKRITEEVSSKQNLKGMKYIFNDLNEMARGLNVNQYAELNTMLFAKFGKDLISSGKKDIEYIIKKGKISNEDEFRLVMARVDEIFADETKYKELAKLNGMLASFEKVKDH